MNAIQMDGLGQVEMATTNLPVQLTSFIGREGDLAEMERLLSQARLVTLTGPGGCGKTRLAIQIAAKVSGEYKDGVWWVDFSPVVDPAILSQLIVQTLGMRPSPDQPMLESLIGFVSSKQMLLVTANSCRARSTMVSPGRLPAPT